MRVPRLERPDHPVPGPDVLDLFAVPAVLRPMPGGQGGSVLAGDLVLSPGRDAAEQRWLCPVLARAAYEIDRSPSRRVLRIAMPVPARDGEWTVQGWGASRYEPGTTACHDLGVLLATARLLHARFTALVPEPPAVVAQRSGRYGDAERIAFGEPVPGAETELAESLAHPVVKQVLRELEGLDPADLGPPQLVHADLAGNVLLDAAGAAVVIDVAPTWRPGRWAEAVVVLDSVLWQGAPTSALADWRTGVARQAMLRAVLFRMLSDRPLRPLPYQVALSALGPGSSTGSQLGS